MLVRIGILTGGGDAPGLNAAIRAVARRAFQLGHSVSGVQNGWAGCLDGGGSGKLKPADVRGILPLGGTILGTSRTNPLKMKDGVATAIRVLRRSGIDAMVPIGGDDTLSVASALHEAGFQTVGVPKTIDNDLSVTEFCIGFDTAVGVVTDALDRLHTTASAHHRVMVVEVMGRDTGWVALAGGVAGGADMIIIPEFPLTLGDVVSHLYRRRRAGTEGRARDGFRDAGHGAGPPPARRLADADGPHLGDPSWCARGGADWRWQERRDPDPAQRRRRGRPDRRRHPRDAPGARGAVRPDSGFRMKT